MNKGTKKTLKVLGIVLGSLCAVVMIAIAIVLNTIVTPERLTPIARKYANEYLDADVKIGSVEGTFFSSFPRFGIKVDSVEVVSHAFHKLETDSVSKRDTILVFAELRAGLDLIHTLRTGEIIIGRSRLKDSKIRLHTDSLGRHNWDILKLSSDDSDDNDTTESLVFSVKHIEIDNAKVRYSDKTSQTFIGADSLCFVTEGDINLDNLDVDVELSDKSTSFKYDGTRYLRKLPLGLKGHIHYDYDDERYELDETCILIDGHDIDLNGWLKTDSTGVDMKLDYGLESPSIEKLFTVIPKDVISQEIRVEDGSISAEGTIEGRLDSISVPVVKCNVALEGIKGHYEGMKRGVEDVTAKFDALIDAQKPDSSFMNLEIFHFKGGNSEVTSTVRATQLLADPYIAAKVKAHVDMASLLDVFPLPGTKMRGKVNADFDTEFRYSDLKNYNFGRIKARGTLDVDSIKIKSDSLDIKLRTDAHIRFMGKDTLKMRVTMAEFHLIRKSLQVQFRDIKWGLKTVLQKDTTQIFPISGRFTAHRVGVLADSVSLYGKNVSGKMLSRPMAWNKKKSHMEASLKADTIFSNLFNVRGLTEKLDAYSMLEMTGDSTWNSDMYAQFEKVTAYMPYYKLPFELTNTRVTQGQRTINVEKSHLKAGNTEMNVSGSLHNLYYSLYAKQPFVATINVDADTIDCNQLISSYVEDEEDYIDTSTLLGDTAVIKANKHDLPRYGGMMYVDSTGQSKIVTFPKRIRFTLSTKVKCLKYEDVKINDINGKLEIKNRCLHATNIRFKHGNSNAISILAYKGHRRSKYAELNAFIRWERADLAGLVSDLHLDTLMPMMSAMKGKVDCYMSLKTKLDSLMEPDMNSLSASVHLGGKSMTLIDGDNFRKVAKMLMFKNKKENIIDTLSMNILVDSSHIQLLPFTLDIDRYQAAVGGSQDFDMNLNYHISLLKSPLPFKAGVTVKGNINNLNWDSFDLTKAKLKKQVKPSDILRNDSISLARRVQVIRETFLMSDLPMPQQLMTAEEKQRAELEALKKAAQELESKQTDTDDQGANGQKPAESDTIKSENDMALAEKMNKND